MSSRRTTTTAEVRDLDLSLDDLHRAVEDYYTTTGLGPDVVGAHDFAELVEETVTEAVDLARWWPEAPSSVAGSITSCGDDRSAAWFHVNHLARPGRTGTTLPRPEGGLCGS